MITANCSKKSDDNTLRNLLILGSLFGDKSERVSMKAGVSVRQRLEVTAGQEFKYNLTQSGSVSSSTLSKNNAFSNSMKISIVDSDNKEVYSAITVPGMSDTISYTPTKSGECTVIIIPNGDGTINASVSGARALNSLNSENSSEIALSGKRKYQIVGALLSKTFFIVYVNEITSIDSTGLPIFTPKSDAIVTLTIGTQNVPLTYSGDIANLMGPGFFTFFAPDNTGKKIRLQVTHPTISDINFDKEITASPTTVSNVKANNISSNINSGTTLTIDKSNPQPITFTWDIPTGANKPETTQIEVGLSNFIFVPADKGSYTVAKELLSVFTSTSTSDDCFGSLGGAGSNTVYANEYFMGKGPKGASFPSMLQIVNFNLNGSLQPNTGHFCEPGVINPLTRNPGPEATFASAGVSSLVVK